MILAELIRRGRGERILVVTPRHLLEQMQHEMWSRFVIPFVRLHSQGVSRVKQKLPANRNPFSYFRRVIISIDTVKQERFVHDLRRHHWDALRLASATPQPVPRLLLRTLRLNCLTAAHGDLWAVLCDPAFVEDEWLLGSDYPEAPSLGEVRPEWTPATPLHRYVDRRDALIETEALVATMLGVTAYEPATIYPTQFHVLHGYDQNDYIYDANGRLVPTQIRQMWRKKGDKLTEEERTIANPAGRLRCYQLPFAPRDREIGFHKGCHGLARAGSLSSIAGLSEYNESCNGKRSL